MGRRWQSPPDYRWKSLCLAPLGRSGIHPPRICAWASPSPVRNPLSDWVPAHGVRLRRRLGPPTRLPAAAPASAAYPNWAAADSLAGEKQNLCRRRAAINPTISAREWISVCESNVVSSCFLLRLILG